MKRQTVEQLLLVFRLFRESYTRGKSLHRAYQEAVREVADRNAVTYQTIGDGCRRRLRLGHIGELYALLETWMDGEPQPLAKQLKEASDASAHADIAAFFASPAASPVPNRPNAGFETSEGRSNIFSLRLSERQARMVRALAEMEGVPPADLLRQLLEPAVEEKMKRVADAILRGSGAPRRSNMTRQDIVKMLRAHEQELRSLGAEHVALFGSTARGDAQPASDVDLAVRLMPGFSQGGFDYFGRFEALRERLAQILACPVDLVEEPVEKARLQKEIDEDRVVAF